MAPEVIMTCSGLHVTPLDSFRYFRICILSPQSPFLSWYAVRQGVSSDNNTWFNNLRHIRSGKFEISNRPYWKSPCQNGTGIVYCYLPYNISLKMLKIWLECIFHSHNKPTIADTFLNLDGLLMLRLAARWVFRALSASEYPTESQSFRCIEPPLKI